MGQLKTARTLAIVSGWMLIVLPIMEFFLASIFFATVSDASIVFRMAPVYIAIILIVRYVSAFVVLWLSRKKAPPTRQTGIVYLVVGILVSFINFGQISMLMGIILLVAGYLTLTHVSKLETQPAVAGSAGFVQMGYQPTPDANPFYNNALQQAVYQLQAGNKLQAYQSFRKLETDNPADINILLWLAYSAPDLEIAHSYIKRAATYRPDSPSVEQAWLWLKQQTDLI